jgi:hypothetical protein
MKKKRQSIFLKIKKVAKWPPPRKKRGEGGLPCHFVRPKNKKVAVTDFK